MSSDEIVLVATPETLRRIEACQRCSHFVKVCRRTPGSARVGVLCREQGFLPVGDLATCPRNRKEVRE